MDIQAPKWNGVTVSQFQNLDASLFTRKSLVKWPVQFRIWNNII